MQIQLFITGGTFDKEYDLINGKLYFTNSHVAEILQRGRNTTDVQVTQLMMMDSLDMGEHERQQIVNACKNCTQNHIIITHGTDTMVETGKALLQEGLNKTIVITGAMIPYTFGSSDGLFNMGSAMAFVQTLPQGVYLAMNGRFYPANAVRKNKETGYFEAL
ncbi:MAG: asparaginase [Chitinophagaceae bacterium]|nr:asparaginase [Chitinophagaceae bacterium]